jgi:hypothetical protein
MDALSTARPKHIGFALGGLAGSNAHGIGFLHAARAFGVKPDLISCTSGMIYWLCRWLEQGDLCKELKAAIAAAEPFAFPPFNWWYLMTHGLTGVFRPAQREYWHRLFRWPPAGSAGQMLDRVFPAQLCVPTRPKADFRSIAKTFNDCATPIFFNSFSPCEGKEFLHMNAPARALYARQQQRRARLRPHLHPETARRLETHLPEVVPAPIDEAAVADALWLTCYGFERPDGAPDRDRRIDGAYARQFILSELSAAEILFMARPQSFRFIGAPPGNSFAVQDLQTELWFNGSYTQQLARIDLVNRLFDKGVLRAPDYHAIELVPVEIEVQRGYFAYFMESLDVFDRAVAETAWCFQRYLPDLGAGARPEQEIGAARAPLALSDTPAR